MDAGDHHGRQQPFFIAADGRNIAELWSRSDAENIGNARLWSTAPRLLKALLALVAYAKWQLREGGDHHPTLPSAVANAEAVIAKATGRGND